MEGESGYRLQDAGCRVQVVRLEAGER